MGQAYAPQGGYNMAGYQQWQAPQGYAFKPTPMDKGFLKGNSDQIFDKHDMDRSGRLDMNEAARAIYELYSTTGQYPSQNDMMYCFQRYAADRSGTLDRQEFKQL